jgi:hypothetical protein
VQDNRKADIGVVIDSSVSAQARRAVTSFSSASQRFDDFRNFIQ